MGAPSGAQGEIHSLALSLFSRCELLPESPFGFVVIDDPVQAMAPGKVDGLARVLATVAKERQVVELDARRAPAGNRLAACRLRRTSSKWYGDWQVACRTIGDPVTQSLSDARTLLRTDDLPAGAAARAVALFCRLAMDAACTRGELYFPRVADRDTPRALIEEE